MTRRSEAVGHGHGCGARRGFLQAFADKPCLLLARWQDNRLRLGLPFVQGWTPKSFPDETVELWDVGKRCKPGDPEGAGNHFRPEISPAGRLLAISSAGAEGRTFLWDVRTEEVVSSLQGKSLPSLPFSNDVAFSSDGSTMATTVGRDVVLWDTKTWQPCITFTGHTRMPNSISFSP